MTRLIQIWPGAVEGTTEVVFKTEGFEQRVNRVPVKREEAKTGRNDPCPCGSGKKYKACHGRD